MRKSYLDSEVLQLAEQVLAKDMVYSEAVVEFHIPLSTVGFLLLKRLPRIDPAMADRVSKKVAVHRCHPKRCTYRQAKEGKI